jgi:hypothetical protein
MKDFKDYIGKTVECLASGDEVFISDCTTFMSDMPYLNQTSAYNDEGEWMALIQQDNLYAKIIDTNNSKLS